MANTVTASGLRTFRFAIAKEQGMIGMQLTNANGETFTAGMDAATFSAFISEALRKAEELAGTVAPSEQGKFNLRADPISIAQIGFGRGRTESEAVVAMRLGILTLPFAMELSTLLSTLEKLQEIVQDQKTPPPRH